MSTTLYRKYRPKSFKEVVGQNHIKTTLLNELETGRIAHAYLFCGPRGVGKTTLARLMAKALNCLNRKEGDGEPCNECESCQEIMASRVLDLIEIDAASQTGVDNVRENIVEGAKFTPSSRKYKVFIIDEVHMLSLSAFNALLKTLEEPPAHAIFILATTEVHKLPATIVSRCQRFDFKKANLDDLTKRLKYIAKEEGKQVEDKIFTDIVRLSEGCIRDAESLLGQVLSLDEKKITAEQADLVIPRSEIKLVSELISYLVKKDSAKAIGLVNRLVQDGVDLEQFTDDLLEFLRKMLLAKISGSLSDFSLDLDEETERLVLDLTKEADLPYLVKAIESLIGKKKEIRQSEIAQLPLELVIVQLCASDDYITPSIDKREKIEQNKAVNDNPPIEPIKKEATKTKTTANKESNGINVAMVHAKWSTFLETVKEKNHSLALILRVCQAEEVNGNKVQLCFQYKFHNDVLQEAKNKQIVDEALSRVFGQNLTFEGIVRKNEEQAALNNILDSFGGELVN